MMLATSDIGVSGDIAAITALVVALTTMIGAVVAAIPAIRRQKATQATVEATHALVNGVHTMAVAREDQLSNALTDAGVHVPDRPSPSLAPGDALPPVSPDAAPAPQPPAGVD